MFKKHHVELPDQGPGQDEGHTDMTYPVTGQKAEEKKTNTIVKGSKLTGNILITYDLQLDGDVEGNITSEQNSHIIMKGRCNGNIITKGGNVEIDGQMGSGDITAGGNVKITGKFSGGKVTAKGKIFVDGEFNGRLEGKEVEIGPRAQGKGEILYEESISIAKGARVEVQISRSQAGQNSAQKHPDAKVVNLERPLQEKKNVKA